VHGLIRGDAGFDWVSHKCAHLVSIGSARGNLQRETARRAGKVLRGEEGNALTQRARSLRRFATENGQRQVLMRGTFGCASG